MMEHTLFHLMGTVSKQASLCPSLPISLNENTKSAQKLFILENWGTNTETSPPQMNKVLAAGMQD